MSRRTGKGTNKTTGSTSCTKLTVYSAGRPGFGARIRFGETAIRVQIDLAVAVVPVLAEVVLVVAVAVAVEALVQVSAAVV